MRAGDRRGDHLGIAEGGLPWRGQMFQLFERWQQHRQFLQSHIIPVPIALRAIELMAIVRCVRAFANECLALLPDIAVNSTPASDASISAEWISRRVRPFGSFLASQRFHAPVIVFVANTIPTLSLIHISEPTRRTP